MFQVYIVGGKYTSKVYIAYCEADQDPLKTFLLHAHVRPGAINKERGDLRMIEENNGCRNTLFIEATEVFDTEEEAFLARNDERSHDTRTVSESTMFPYAVSERCANKQKQNEWTAFAGAKKCVIARDGFKEIQEYFKLYPVAKKLAETHGRDQVAHDLDHTSFIEFVQKYQIQFD